VSGAGSEKAGSRSCSFAVAARLSLATTGLFLKATGASSFVLGRDSARLVAGLALVVAG